MPEENVGETNIKKNRGGKSETNRQWNSELDGGREGIKGWENSPLLGFHRMASLGFKLPRGKGRRSGSLGRGWGGKVDGICS